MKADDVAFPYNHQGKAFNELACGLSIRDYIAIKAMLGLLSNALLKVHTADDAEEALVFMAYSIADSMIAESEKK